MKITQLGISLIDEAIKTDAQRKAMFARRAKSIQFTKKFRQPDNTISQFAKILDNQAAGKSGAEDAQYKFEKNLMKIGWSEDRIKQLRNNAIYHTDFWKRSHGFISEPEEKPKTKLKPVLRNLKTDVGSALVKALKNKSRPGPTAKIFTPLYK